MFVLFMLYRFLLSKLGIEKLGVWSLLIASVTASRVSEFGIGGSVTRFVARYCGRGESLKAAWVVETGLLSVAISMALLLIIGYPALEWWLKRTVEGPPLQLALGLLPYTVVFVWLSSLYGVALAGLDGCQRMDLRCVLVLISQILMLVLAVLLVPRYGLYGVAYAQLVQNAFLIVGGWTTLRQQLDGIKIFPRRWNLVLFKEMLGYGAQFQIAGVAAMLYDPITKTLLSRFGGLSMVGYYEMASQMVTKLRGLLIAGNQALVPTIAQFDGGESSQVRNLYDDAYNISLYLALPFYAAIVAGAPMIASIWIGHDQPDFVIFSVFVAGGWLVNTLSTPAYFANLGTGRLRWNTLSHIVIGILNVVLGFVLGKLLGGLGVVLGWALALALGSIVILLGWRQDHRTDTDARKHFSFRLLGAVCAWAAVFANLIYRLLSEVLPIPAVASLMMLAFCVLVIPAVWLHPSRARLSGLLRRLTLSASLWIVRGG